MTQIVKRVKKKIRLEVSKPTKHRKQMFSGYKIQSLQIGYALIKIQKQAPHA